MDVTRTMSGEVVELGVDGRLDGYWADHLDSAIAEEVRGGHHRIRLNLAKVTFLSSAGIAVIMKYHKQLTPISGSIRIINPAPAVQTVLDITRLTPLLVKAEPSIDATVRMMRPGRPFERAGVGFEIFDLAGAAALACRAIGTDEPLRSGGFREEHMSSLGGLSPLFAVGVGAFGANFADCRARFGDMLSVAGATAYQPADGTNVPDYLLSSGPMAADVRVLYCLACEGQFSRLARFESIQAGEPAGLGGLLESCLEMAGAPAIGVAMVAETAGLIGAALRRSPATDGNGDFFDHPAIRARLGFTAERAFLRTVTVAAGIVTRPDNPQKLPQLRPIGAGGLLGHVHAAAFSFRPIADGLVDFKDTVASLFEAEKVLGVLHLLHDDRGAAGVGESEFARGACWMGPIR